MWATIKKEVISLLLFCFPDQHILLMLKRPRVKVTEKKKKSYSVPDKRASLSEETCIDSRVCVEEGAGGRQCEVEVRPGWHGRGVVTCGPTRASCRYPAPEDLLTVMSFDSCHLLCVVKILWRGHGVLVFDVLFFFLLTFSFFLFFQLFCRTEMGESGLLNFHQNRPAGCYIFFWWGVMCSWLFWGEEELVHSGSRWIKKKSVWVAFEGGLKTEHSINPPYSTVASVDVARQRVDCKGVLQFVE